jgi:colanic acid/amylovoran biosynthesis glycosyltransferase
MSSKKSYRFKVGITTLTNGVCFKSLILNQFIISKNLDWLHFGFGTVAIGRENLAAVMNAKMAVSFRGFDLYLSPLKRKNYYDLLFEKTARYHVLSEMMKCDLVKQGVLDHTISVITPAIDTLFFKKNQSHSEGSIIKILTVGRLHWKKGLEYTLEAMVGLKDLNVNFEYTIIGSGNQLERLKFATHQLGINKNVYFVGELKPAEVRDYMSKSDMYVQYSIQEGFCNAVLEAQAMGLLCLVSNAEGLAENVLDGKTGWVIPKRSPQVLAQKIMAIIDMPEIEKQRVRDHAILRVKHQFNIEKQQQEFIQFYSEL